MAGKMELGLVLDAQETAAGNPRYSDHVQMGPLTVLQSTGSGRDSFGASSALVTPTGTGLARFLPSRSS